MKTDDESFGEKLNQEIERLLPSDLTTALFRDRPYDGQPHTDTGERGKTMVSGITFRDLRDAFVRGAFAASGLPPSQYPTSIYNLPWGEMDILAVQQNMACEVEKMMGIYPNVPKLRFIGDDEGAASATGESGAASATGWGGAASATGERGAAECGDTGCAAATGSSGRAKGGDGSVIALMYEPRRGAPRMCCATVGRRRGDLAPGVWYELDWRGRFRACKVKEEAK